MEAYERNAYPFVRHKEQIAQLDTETMYWPWGISTPSGTTYGLATLWAQSLFHCDAINEASGYYNVNPNYQYADSWYTNTWANSYYDYNYV